MSNTATQISEEQAITFTIQQYIDGGKSGRGEDMRPAFHKDATIFGYYRP
ncbi:MAG: nuclear transport factor 2 family protein [Pyrinomonadaceae bacterium]